MANSRQRKLPKQLPKQLPKLVNQLLLVFSSFLYGILLAVIAAVAIAGKNLAILIGDQLLYKIMLLGEVLRAIDLMQISNIIIFAWLGMGCGLVTWLLPLNIGRRVSAIALILLIPLVLSTAPIVRYYDWLGKIEENQKISGEQAIKLTDNFLQKHTWKTGILGFYFYTGQMPLLPSSQEEMQDFTQVSRNMNSQFVRFTGIPPAIISFLMTMCFWLLRIFYGAIAIVASIIHFQEGLRLVKR